MSWPFYHRDVSRLKAEELLLANKEDGSYLVRDSESYPGAYALCIMTKGRTHTYRILPDGSGKLFLESSRPESQRKFVDLGQLIHECEQRGDNGQFICALRHPVQFQDYDEEVDSEKESDDECECENSSQQSQDDLVTRFFLQRFASLDLSSFDEKFIDELRKYIESGARTDATAVTSSEGKPKLLQKLLASAATDLRRSMQHFLRKLYACQQLFTHSESAQSIPEVKINEDFELSELLEKISSIKDAVNCLEKKAIKRFQYLQPSDYEEVEEQSSTDLVDRNFGADESAVKPFIPPSNFKVKLVGLGKLTHKDVVLTVDLQAGKLYTVRPSKDVLDSSNTFTHDRIAQLIKCTTNNCRLDVKIDERKKDTYLFEDARQREHFCQSIQQMKMMHSKSQTVDEISLYIGTWNMGEAVPAVDLTPWLKSQGNGKVRDAALSLIPHDVYVIGTQESSLSEKEWINRIKNSLLTDIHLVSSVSLWDIRLVVFVKTEYKNKISHVQTSTVGTGIANTLGNKGGVGISFHFDGTAFCFVNSHLASGNEIQRWKRRNQNFRDIIRGLSLSNKQLSTFDLTHQFHHLFWFGDLNYRLEMDQIWDILKYIKGENFHLLLQKDQLSISQEKKDAFHNFNEEEITFPPSYRFQKGSTNKYAWEKMKKTGLRINVPSWCDRVLWKCYPETYISCTSYGSVPGIWTSDHKPVFATFNVGIASQFVSKGGESDDLTNVKISFETVSAKIKTRSESRFLLEIYSTCLDGSTASKANNQHDSRDNTYCHPRWSSECIPKLIPIVGNMEYLADQHLLIAVKGVEGMESYGECVLALKSMFSVIPQPFECELTHRGESIGVLSGYMNVKSDELHNQALSRRRLKSYELIYMDTQLVPREGHDSDTGIREPHLLAPMHANSFYQRDPQGQRKYENVPDPGTLSLDTVEGKSEKISATWETNHTKGRAVYDVPQAPPRRPRLGQSSFNQVSVLPAVSPTKPSATTVAHKVNAINGSSPVPPPVPPHAVKLPISGLPPPPVAQHSVKTTSPCNKLAPPPVPPHANKPLCSSKSNPVSVLNQGFSRVPSKREGFIAKTLTDSRHVYSEVAVDSVVYDDPCSERGASLTPAERSNTNKYKVKGDHHMDTYEGLSKPQTVNAWLLDLGLPQYIQAFLAEGWDQIDFVDDITELHLLQMKVYNKAHRKRILDSITDFKNWKKEKM